MVPSELQGNHHAVWGTQLKEEAEGWQATREVRGWLLQPWWRVGAKHSQETTPLRTSFCWHCLAAGA